MSRVRPRPTRPAHAAWVAAGLAGVLPLARADQPLWEVGLGIGALRLPHYRGSDQSRDWVVPVPYIAYRGDILKADREGARAVLFDTERLDFDVSVAATAPTRSDRKRRAPRHARPGGRRSSSAPTSISRWRAGPTGSCSCARRYGRR